MDVTSALAAAANVQNTLLMFSYLSLTPHLYPPHTDVEDLPICDYIVVGAGTAGCIVANRLTENPEINVCLIEAGGDPPIETQIPSLFPYLPKTRLDWNFTSEDDGITAQYHRNKYLDLPSGRVLGGSSAIHHFYHVYGDPKDYDDWAKATGDDAWSWKKLQPYIIKSERIEDPFIMNSKSGKYHGTNGNIRITRESRDLPIKYLKAYEEVGHKIVDDVNNGETLGFTRPMFSISGGVRQGSAEAYLSTIKNRPNLYVVKNTVVTKILLNEKKEATGVQCTTSDGNTHTINARKEVIISAGAFNTPKLLMLSGIGPRDHLNSLDIPVVNDAPVGEGLQDHIAVMLINLLEATNEVPKSANPYQFPVETFIGFGAVNKSQNYPDYMTLNLICRNNPAALMQLCSSVFAFNDDLCNQLYLAGVGREVQFIVYNLGRPTSTGTVLLNSKDPNDKPKIHTGFLSKSIDLEKNVDGIMDLIRVMESSHLKNVGAKPMYFDFPSCRGQAGNTRDYWRCYVRNVMDTTFHYSGTCAMGTVLDSSLRVKGVSKLRVVDASAMPNLTSSNINAAVVVLAEKAADLIKRSQTCA